MSPGQAAQGRNGPGGSRKVEALEVQTWTSEDRIS